MFKRYMWAAVALAIVLLTGTVGYRLIGGGQSSWVDAFYMTTITITTIGFGEIIDLSGKPLGRLFTIFIAVSGIGVLSYVVTNLFAFAIEGELTKSFWRRRMERTAKASEGHYIVCGVGDVGFHIVAELDATNRPYVVVETERKNLERAQEAFRRGAFLEGNPTDDDCLRKAGIEKAKGLFAATGDDNENVVVSLTAKQLNPALRVVAQSSVPGNAEKMRKAGADAVISPGLIGALRMASEMVRPAAISFLDIMLRDRERNLRVEEVQVPAQLAGRAISALHLRRYSSSLLLAVRTGGSWVYNPPEDYVLQPSDTLIVMTTPEERQKLETGLAAE